MGAYRDVESGRPGMGTAPGDRLGEPCGILRHRDAGCGVRQYHRSDQPARDRRAYAGRRACRPARGAGRSAGTAAPADGRCRHRDHRLEHPDTVALMVGAATYLRVLENEAVYVIREAIAQFERPVILFSGGKDSVVLTWLVRKALHPGKLTVPLLHIDTGHNFPETLAFRYSFAREMNCPLIVRRVQDSIDAGRVRDEVGPHATRNSLQTITLLDAVRDLRVDCAFGGGRRDEEKARAKERMFSHRDTFGQWDPRNQR